MKPILNRTDTHPRHRWPSRLLVPVVSLLAAGIPAVAQAQPTSQITPRFAEVASTDLPDGRFHALVEAEVPSSGHALFLDDVRWNGAGIDIDVEARRVGGPNDLPVITRLTLPISLENLPAGRYPVSVGEDTVEVTVPEQRRFRQPLSATLWPADATDLDTLWLLFEPLHPCTSHELLSFSADSDLGSGDIVLQQHPDECPDADAPPRLAAVELGTAAAGDYHLRLAVWREDESPDQYPREDGRLFLRVAEGPGPRIGGSWYDPDQAGQGMNLEVIEDGDVLMYWYTFDDAGEPAWIIGQGHPTARSVSLYAETVQGGRFPPYMDPDQIERRPWGQVHLSFDSCNQGGMHWETAQPRFQDGTMSIHRLTGRQHHDCAGPPSDAELTPAWYHGPDSYARLPDID